jgi:Response regulator containing CheY-like receiver, AAA-type ATPase, and DNA-binding domains
MTHGDLTNSCCCVLLVDDDPAMEYVFQKCFQKEGITVRYASTAIEGIELLSERSFDAILLDLVIPGPLNGFAVISYLETEQPKMLERLYITSGMPEQTIMHAVPELLPRYYRKPFDHEEIVRNVTAQIRKVNGARRPDSRILVADDEPDTRAALARLVRETGRTSVEAADGHEAIRLLGRDEFDGLILDLVMPYVDGFGVLRYLRQTNQSMLRRTIVLTGMPRQYRENPLLDNVGALLEKPANLVTMRQALTELTGVSS